VKLEVRRPLVIESLEIAFTSPVALRFSGALMTEPAQHELERVLGDVHSHILAAKITSFTVDVRPLNFVNSSALRVFINWISRAERARYKLVFVTNPRVTWHRLNFSVLKSLAPQTVEVVDGSGLGAEGGSSRPV
jgi:hypothetical protein